MSIRNSAKAIIVKGDQVLLTKNKDKEGYFYLCPGGGQEHGENLHDALKRECIEEIGKHVEVEGLIYIREYIGKNHEHADCDSHLHQVEFYFSCKLKEEEKSAMEPTNPDEGQLGVEWLNIKDLLEYRLYPKELRQHLIHQINGKKSPVYLGDVN